MAEEAPLDLAAQRADSVAVEAAVAGGGRAAREVPEEGGCGVREDPEDRGSSAADREWVGRLTWRA